MGDGCGCGLATWHGAMGGGGRCVASAAPVDKGWGVMVEIERAIFQKKIIFFTHGTYVAYISIKSGFHSCHNSVFNKIFDVLND